MQAWVQKEEQSVSSEWHMYISLRKPKQYLHLNQGPHLGGLKFLDTPAYYNVMYM